MKICWKNWFTYCAPNNLLTFLIKRLLTFVINLYDFNNFCESYPIEHCICIPLWGLLKWTTGIRHLKDLISCTVSFYLDDWKIMFASLIFKSPFQIKIYLFLFKIDLFKQKYFKCYMTILNIQTKQGIRLFHNTIRKTMFTTVSNTKLWISNTK